MNPLAQQLNTTLDPTIVGRVLSQLGRRMFFPKGIVAQSAEATAKAHRFNATVGMAVGKGKPLTLPSLEKQLPTLTTKESVAYAPTAGIPALRQAWEQQILQKNPSLQPGHFSHPVVIPGLTSGIFQAAELFLDPGDQALLADMFWGNYRLIIEDRREAKLTTFPYFTEDGKFHIEAFDTALQNTKGKKLLIVLNFPNNPSGYTPTKDEATKMTQAMVRAADRGLDLVVVCDDAYFGLFYEENCETESLFAKLAQAHPNILAVKIDGATKEDLVWGFRIGFMSFGAKGLTPEHHHALIQKLMGSIRATVSSSPTISQNLLLHTLASPTYNQEKADFFQLMIQRYQTVKAYLSSPEALEFRDILVPLPFNSGYFMGLQCKGFSAEDLRINLLEQGIGTIAIGTQYLRIAFSSVDQEDTRDLFQAIFQTARRLVE